MCDFKPGDEVVCVDADEAQPSDVQGRGRRDPLPLVKGEQYTIAGSGVWPGDNCTAVVFLREVRNDDYGTDVGFLPRRFRKVQRRDLSAWLATTNTIEEPKREKESQHAPAA